MLEGVVFWLGAEALGISMTAPEALAVIVLASLSALIPAGPGYVGTYDVAALFALHEVGVKGGAAVSCLLLSRFVIFVPISVVGLGMVILRYGGMRDVLRREHVEARQPDQSDAIF